jgi:hypothetical protein
MLPFLKPKTVAGVVISKRKPDGSQAPIESENQPDHALEACAEDLIRGMEAKDAKAVASAIKYAFEILQSQPEAAEEVGE